jgi:cell division protein FtsB/DNA-binding CsgD family transcriptional regulator
MLKRIIIAISLFELIFPTKFFAAANDSLYYILDKTIERQSFYISQKEQRIERLKQLLSIDELTPKQQFDINNKLYDEYRKYQTDSATSYILKNKEISDKLSIDTLIIDTNIKMAYLYSARGLYIEAKNLLDDVAKSALTDRLLPDYYEVRETFCSGYGQSNNNIDYYLESAKYRDSLLSVLDPSSLRYQTAYAAKLLYSNADGEELLLALMNATDASKPERGIVAYFLGYLYQMKNKLDLAEKYFSISAISDIENCIRDNASIRALSLLYFAGGNIDRAYKLMEFAINDALACRLPYRTVEISASYPIINAAYQKKEDSRKRNLQIMLLIISVLLIFLAAGLAYIYKQMQRLAAIKNKLHETNSKLNELNKNLYESNHNLEESNIIKEEYIAHFFNLCSAYIDKMEAYRRTLNKYASNEQFDDLRKMLRSNKLVETELKELYNRFDIIFLNLYPSFVEEFNALQTHCEQVVPKKGELMNTELRIFALIRLGITDSVKIADFLRYSISTIYNYRVKARNNATVSRERFEEYVMKIGAKKIENAGH